MKCRKGFDYCPNHGTDTGDLLDSIEQSGAGCGEPENPLEMGELLWNPMGFQCRGLWFKERSHIWSLFDEVLPCAEFLWHIETRSCSSSGWFVKLPSPQEKVLKWRQFEWSWTAQSQQSWEFKVIPPPMPSFLEIRPDLGIFKESWCNKAFLICWGGWDWGGVTLKFPWNRFREKFHLFSTSKRRWFLRPKWLRIDVSSSHAHRMPPNLVAKDISLWPLEKVRGISVVFRYIQLGASWVRSR